MSEARDTFATMAFAGPPTPQYSRMAGWFCGLLWIVYFPVWLVVVCFYQFQMMLASRRLGVSATALSPMTTRWLQHRLGVRRDDACGELIKVLPHHSYAGLCAAGFPILLGHRLTGFVPRMFRYPYEGTPPLRHTTAVRATFVDAAMERYLPGVTQFVELGAGFDTRTVRLQQDRRIRCFEVDLPRTQQLKRDLLRQSGVDTSGITYVSANFSSDDWLENLVQAGFDPRAPAFFLWEGVTYYLSREAMENTFRTIAMAAPGSVVVFDYATEAVAKVRRTPIGRLQAAYLMAVRESQTFWIPGAPPVKQTLAGLLDGYGFALREQLDYGRETKAKGAFGGLAAAVVKGAGPAIP